MASSFEANLLSNFFQIFWNKKKMLGVNSGAYRGWRTNLQGNSFNLGTTMRDKWVKAFSRWWKSTFFRCRRSCFSFNAASNHVSKSPWWSVPAADNRWGSHLGHGRHHLSGRCNNLCILRSRFARKSLLLRPIALNPGRTLVRSSRPLSTLCCYLLQLELANTTSWALPTISSLVVFFGRPLRGLSLVLVHPRLFRSWWSNSYWQ